MEFKVLSVLKKYMSEEEFKAFESKGLEFEKALNGDITKYIEVNTPKVEDVKSNAQKEVIASLGLEGVEDVEGLKNHIKVVSDTTTDKDKALLKWEKDFNEMKLNYDTEVTNRTKLENEQRLSNEMALLGNIFSEEEEKEFYHYKFSKLVTEEKDFKAVVDEYSQANGLETTQVYVKDEFGGNSGAVDIGAAWKAKREKERK